MTTNMAWCAHSRRRAIMLVFLVGVLTLVASCRASDNAHTGPLTQPSEVDLQGIDVEMHHAVG